MDLSYTLRTFIGRRLSKKGYSKYIEQEVAELQVNDIEELPTDMQIAIHREAAYLRGLVDGIRMYELQNDLINEMDEDESHRLDRNAL